MQVTKETRNARQFANEKSASVYERFPFILPYNAHPVLFKNSVGPRQQGRNADAIKGRPFAVRSECEPELYQEEHPL